MNRAREFVQKALWYIHNHGNWQTVSTLLELALGEIAELEQTTAALPNPPTIKVLPGGQSGGLVVAELSERHKTTSYSGKRLVGPSRGITEASTREKRL